MEVKDKGDRRVCWAGGRPAIILREAKKGGETAGFALTMKNLLMDDMDEATAKEFYLYPENGFDQLDFMKPAVKEYVDSLNLDTLRPLTWEYKSAKTPDVEDEQELSEQEDRSDSKLKESEALEDQTGANKSGSQVVDDQTQTLVDDQTDRQSAEQRESTKLTPKDLEVGSLDSKGSQSKGKLDNVGSVRQGSQETKSQQSEVMDESGQKKPNKDIEDLKKERMLKNRRKIRKRNLVID